MSLRDDRTQLDQRKSRLQLVAFNRLKSRLDAVRLECTVAALHEILPDDRANDAEATLRRMFARAQRWAA